MPIPGKEARGICVGRSEFRITQMGQVPIPEKDAGKFVWIVESSESCK